MPRIELNINKDWLFNPHHAPEHMKTMCDEDTFEVVHLPHTNRTLPYCGFDDRRYQFVSSYRKHLSLNADLRGKRIFMDFGAAMTVARVYVNGHFAHEHKGGFTPFSVDLTPYLEWNDDEIIAVELDSTEREDIPPFGGQIDFLTFGGLYRDVSLRVVNPLHIENVFVRSRGILDSKPHLRITAMVVAPEATGSTCRARFSVTTLQGKCILEAEVRVPAFTSSTEVAFTFDETESLEYWDMDNPRLYMAKVELLVDAQVCDCFEARFGFREAKFTPEGFVLNGKLHFLRGLNRHQSFPWVGNAMPARVQRRDADIIRSDFNCNFVRASHYPQSPHFLDRCDEIGLLVFEEIPGWQHIGGEDWKETGCQNVRDMILRDFNHPSIILWGVRVNESQDDDEFYTETNRIAHQLDDTRQTSGARFIHESNCLEDVFAYNDFEPDRIKSPNHPLYIISEFCGHTCPTKNGDNVERITQHTRRHASILSQAVTTPGISAAIGWCAFDYNTHKDFGSGDRICHHGIADIFRIPKYSAGLYMAQCDPTVRPVLEPAFSWSCGDYAGGGGVGQAIINSNCDRLKVYLGNECADELLPDKEGFPGLEHPPFFLSETLMSVWGARWKPLCIDGYVGSDLVITRHMSGNGIDHDFILNVDDTELVADGSDATRVWFKVVDEFGNRQNFASGTIEFALTGPATIIGDNPFALVGGSGAVWVRATTEPGLVVLTARHTNLGTHSLDIRIVKADADCTLSQTIESLELNPNAI